MPSKFTQNYHLSQWEPEDKVVHDDFNADNAAIDKAIKEVDQRVDGKADVSALSSLEATVNTKASQSDLNSLTQTVNTKASQSELEELKTTVSKKAEQSALETLKTTVSAKGNCQLVTGSYSGSGKYGASNPNSLPFDQKPWLVLICGPKFAIMARNHATGYILPNSTGASLAVSWTAAGVSWYGNSSDGTPSNQLNESGKKYYYIAFVEA